MKNQWRDAASQYLTSRRFRTKPGQTLTTRSDHQVQIRNLSQDLVVTLPKVQFRISHSQRSRESWLESNQTVTPSVRQFHKKRLKYKSKMFFRHMNRQHRQVSKSKLRVNHSLRIPITTVLIRGSRVINQTLLRTRHHWRRVLMRLRTNRRIWLRFWSRPRRRIKRRIWRRFNLHRKQLKNRLGRFIKRLMMIAHQPS